MGLIELFVMIVVIGVLLWLVNTYMPMDGKIKQILNITVVVLLVLFLLSLFLPLGQLSNIRVGK
jgi:hypothetical protein